MSRNFLIIFIWLLLYNCSKSLPVYSLPFEPDSLSYVYKGIPENRIFNSWLFLGPIIVKEDDRNEQEKVFNTDPILDQDYCDASKRFIIRDSSYIWNLVHAGNAIIEDGIIDLSKALGNFDLASAYAYARIEMQEDLECILGIGSDDAVKIWLNGELVHSNWTARGLYLDNDLVPVELKKGNNDILVKIHNRGGSWAFVCHAILPPQYAQQLNFNAQIGNTENIKQLFKCGVDINSTSNWGLTPLQTARLYNQEEMAEFLLQQGADPAIPFPPKEKMIDTYFNFITKEVYPGAAVLISKDGHILFEKAFGYANLEYEVPFKTDTKFRIASVTKQFTAAAILKLQELGLLNVNDLVSKYLPELPRSEEVTIHQLLTHSSGIQRDWNEGLYTSVPAVFETNNILSEIKNSKFQFNPGESWSYSNLGYAVLTLIIERASGLSYIDFLSKNFFEPLGMRNTGVHKWNELIGCEVIKNEACGYYFKNGKIYRSLILDRGMGAGALYSTIEDLFTWNEALYNNKILNQPSLGAVLSPVQTKDGSPDKYGLQYGYGLFLHDMNGFRHLEHGGAIDGYECSLNRYTGSNMNIIVMFNRFPFPAGINANIVAREIARVYLKDEVKSE